MIASKIITPKAADTYVSHQTNLGVNAYDLTDLYSPDTALWKSKVLDLGSPKYPPQVATAPTRYWFDRSRYNNHGTIVGAVWKQLPSGDRVLSFDGDDYIELTASQLNFTTENFTLSAWFRLDNLLAEQTVLIRGLHNTDGYRWRAHTNGSIIFSTYQSGAGQETSTGVNSITANQWFNIVVTRSGASVRILRNGIDATSVAGAHINPTTSARTVKIGIYNDKVIQPLYGKIGKVLILGGWAVSAEFVKWYYLRTKWRYGL